MARFDPLRRARRQLSAAPFNRALKLRFTRLERGLAVVRMPLGPALQQYQGIVHGGAVASLADTAATFATNSLLGPEEDSITIELKLNYLKPGVGRHLEATGEVLHHGRKT